MRSARGGVSLTITLAVSISLLVLIAVAVVLGLGLTSGMRNTMALLRDKSDIVVSTMVERVRSHLEPAQEQECPQLFFTSPSPGTIALFMENSYHPSYETYIENVGAVMKL